MSISDFLTSIRAEMPRCDAERVGAERYGSPRLSAFELLGTNENVLSNVLAELFDPRGAHGQGTLFLNALLRAIGERIVHTREPVKITREFVTKHRRRIDILIETNSALIGIENKPFAVQSENQLSDYQKDLEERAGKRKPRLIFISDSDPDTAKEYVTPLRFYDWGKNESSICGLLDEVHGDIRSYHARAFVEDFGNWIKRHFGGEDNMMDELEFYAEEILKHFEIAEERKSIGAVLLAGDRIRREVIDKIGSHIWCTLLEAYPDLEGEDGELSGRIDQKHTAWKIRRPSWPENCCLAIEAGKNSAGGVFYGVRALKPETANARNSPDSVCFERDIIEGSLQDVANGSSTNWWPWYQMAPTSNWTQDFIARLLIDTDGRVETHNDVERMSADLLRLADAIEDGLVRGKRRAEENGVRSG